MNSEQNKIINDKDNNNDNSKSTNFLTQLKEKINSIEDNKKDSNDIKNEEKIKDKNDFKTENKEKKSEDDFIMKIEEGMTNNNNTLNNNDSNFSIEKEKKLENKDSNEISNETFKNDIQSNENQQKINVIPNDIDQNTLSIKLKEENKIISKNIIINNQVLNKTENLNNDSEKNNKIDINEKNKTSKEQETNIEEKTKEKHKNINQEKPKEKNIISNNEKEEEKEKQHNLSPSCLNKCIQWILNADIKNKNLNQNINKISNNFKTHYTFFGSSSFFKKLEQSLINSLHNPQNISSSFYRNMAYQGILDSLKIESNKKLDSININSKEQISSLKDLLNLNYPLDNTKTNYSIIDANLCMKENLKNLFLIEFDLGQIKENNNNNQDNKENCDFRKINDDCVEREIDFKLNGFFHGKKMFQKDLTFSVGYRDFIKGIQFQIKQKIQKMKNFQNNLFAKVLNNANIGIEFFVPSLTENSQTNFNAIVNSNIEINKIYLELTIPNNFINNKINITPNIIEGMTEDSYSISTKKTEINSPKKEDNNVSNSVSNHSNINLNYNNNNKMNVPNRNCNFTENLKNILFHSNVSSPSFPNLGINRSIPASPHLNNYQNFIYQQKYSPLITSNMNNNMNFNLVNNNFQPILNQNRFYPTTPNYPLSPVPPQPQQIFCSPQTNTYSPLSASLMMKPIPYTGKIMQPQPYLMNSPFNTSNYSSPYMGQNQNRNTPSFNSLNNRKISESFQNENQINNSSRNAYNSNHQTPLIMRRQEEEYINQFLSPKSVGPSTSFNLANNFNLANINLNMNKINNSGYQLNPMNNINQMKQQMNQMGNFNQMGNVIPMTIRQKIFEKTKNEEVDKINKILNTMNRIRPNNNNNNNMNNINNFNNFSSNNNIRTNIMKSNMIPSMNLNNTNNLNNFNNINAIKNFPSINNIQNMQNNSTLTNIMNVNNNINLNNINNINNINRMNNIINNINTKKNINIEKGEMSENQKIKNIFILENQNKSNLDLFLKTVTPLYKISTNTEYLKLKINKIFESLKLMSILGLKTIYYNDGELLNIWYSLSLSSLLIKVTNKKLINEIFQEIKNKRKIQENLILKQNEEITFTESFFTLNFTTEYLDISFIETKPDYFRKSYNSLIKSLSNSIPFFDKISLEDIDLTKSFFAIYYSSVKIQKPFTPHSFLVYYYFNNEYNQENNKGITIINEKYFRQNIAGILPFKVNNEFFLQKINFSNNLIYNSTTQSYGCYNPDNFPLINITYKVLNEINKYTRGNSYDYEHFFKMKNYNYK